MPNAWVMHVKKWSAANNKSYGCAVSDPDCKSSYKKPVKEKKPPKSKEEKKQKKENFQEMKNLVNKMNKRLSVPAELIKTKTGYRIKNSDATMLF